MSVFGELSVDEAKKIEKNKKKMPDDANQTRQSRHG